ncbi:proline--tRNA ligase, partial [archaeon]|nr:proline--tRNA ligase [archaeon]
NGEDKGLVLPQRIAKNKGVIVPIIFDKTKEKVLKKAKEIEKELKSLNVFLDARDNYSAGWKFSDWELKGIPIRIEIGPKDIEKKQVVLVRRDNGKKEFVKEKDLKKRFGEILEEMQKDMFKKAEKFLNDNIVEAKNYDEFKKYIKERKMVYAYFSGDPNEEEKIKEETGATTRCTPFDEKEKDAKCIFSGKPAKQRVLFAKAY